MTLLSASHAKHNTSSAPPTRLSYGRHTDRPWLVHLDHCPSTNTWALDHLDELGHGSVVLCDEQSAGRGQAGRHWVADRGVLTASFIIDLHSAAGGPQLALAAGLAVIHSLDDLARPLAQSLDLQLKWPNDLYARGRKLAGILCEARCLDQGLRAVVGIGLNVAPQWADRPPAAAYTGTRAPIALRHLLVDAALPAHVPLCAAIRRYLLEASALLQNQGLHPLLPELRHRLAQRGQSIAVDLGQGPQLVTVHDLDDAGQLVIGLPGGGHRSLDSARALVHPGAESTR